MAIIYSYPLNTPKRDDLLIGTITYDEDAVNPVHGNPTVSFTVGSLLDLIASQGAAQNLQQVTNIGNTTTNSIVISNSLKVAGGYYDSSNQPGTAGQLLSSTATGTQWVNVAAQGVTSVGLSMPAAFTVANSPITQSGTLTVTGAGTAAQYINGLGNLVTFPTIPTQYVLPVATTVALGGIKIGYTQNAKNYPIVLSNEQAYVNVPWTDTPYTLPVATSTDLGGVKIGYTQTLKKYPVELLNEQMFVDVPWTDTPYTLPVATSTDLGGVKIGYTTDATARNYAVSLDNEQMLVNVPWTDTQNPFQTITGTGSDNTDSGVLLSNSGGTVLILGAGSVAASQTGNTITLTGTDTGVTGVTLAIADSTGTPLSESITNRELTLTSSKYVGGANVGYVPEGGTGTTYLKGDGTWAAIPTGLQFKGTWDASGGGGGTPDLTDASNKGAGFLWICDVAGTAYPNGGTNPPSTWNLGDWAVYDGTAWTRVPATNSGVTSLTTTDGTFIDLTPNTATTGAVTVTADLSAQDGTSDTNTRFLSKDNTWDVPSYTGAGVTSLTSVKGTYIDITNNSTATGAVGLGTVDLNAVDGTSDTATKFLSKDNTWDVPSYTTDTNTIYDLENSGSGSTGDISLVTGDVVATADVNGASSGNSITYDNESPTSGILDGQIVRGTGVPAGTRVVSHTATVLTLNQTVIVANNAVLSFHTADTVRLVGAGATVVDKNSGNIRITSTNTQNTYTAGAGLSVSNFVFSADIDTTAASSATNNLSTDSGRYYAVQLDNNSTAADRKMVVNVPWLSGGTYNWTIKDNAANPGSSVVDSGETIQFVTATGALGTALTEPSAGNFVMTLTSPNTTYSNFTAASSGVAGASGLVVAPPAGAQGKFLRGDATWVSETTYSTFTGADGTNAGTSGLVPAPTATDNVKFLKGDGTWAATPQGDITEIKTTAPITGAATSGIATIAISNMGAATASVAGTKGAVPASAAGDQAKFLRADATWVVPTDTNTNTTYTIESANSKQISLVPSDVSGTASAANNYTNTNVIQVDTVVGTIANGYLIEGTGIPAGVFIINIQTAGGIRILTLSQAVTVANNTSFSFKARTAVTLADGTGITISGNNDTITIANSDGDTGLPAIIVDDAQGNMSFGNANVTATTVRTKIGAGTGDGLVESLTTTGTSGAATLSNAGVLNIPEYENTQENTKWYVRDSGDDDKTINDAKYLKFVTATGALSTNLTGTGSTSDPFVMTLTSPDTVYSLPLAADGTRGGIQIGYAESGKNYPVELDSEKAYVNVPWTDTVYTLPLAANGTRGGVQIGYSENGKNYPVELSSEKMFVNVPWTDNNSVDYINAATFNTGNGILTGTGVGNAGFSVDLDGRYLTSYTETDTLAAVTGRGATTGTACSFTNTTSFLVGSGGVGGSGIGSIFLGNIISSTAAGNGLRFHTNNINAYIDTKLANIYFRDYADNAGSVFTRFTMNTNTGTFTATGDVVAYSDQRLKTDIKTLDGSKVYKMRGVEFIKDGKQSSGVIAQELEKVAPELVNSDSEYKSVAYGNISGYLIEAIKELKQEIEELKSKSCNCN